MMMSYLKSSLLASVWFMFLTFPFMVIKVNTLKSTVEWRWMNLLWVAIAAFVLSSAWRWAMEKRKRGSAEKEEDQDSTAKTTLGQKIYEDPKVYRPLLVVVAIAAIAMPFVSGMYQVTIWVFALFMSSSVWG